MKTLIVNADDFGLAPGVNQGIVDAARDGIVTSTSIMVAAPFIKDAMELLATSGVSLGLGLHIVLNGELPTFSRSPLFTTSDGYLPLSEWDASDEGEFLKEIRFELRSQFEAFERLTGKKPDHMDSHHNICFKQPQLRRATLELIAEYAIPIRDPAKTDWLTAPTAFRPTDELSEELRAVNASVVRTLRDFRGDGANLETLLNTLRTIPTEGVYELMCHVGYVDEVLMTSSSYNELRQVELDVLRRQEVKEVLKAEGISLATYEQAFSLSPR